MAQYLIDHHGFEPVYLQRANREEEEEGSKDIQLASPVDGPSNEASRRRPSKPAPKPQHTFATPNDLLDFITKHWQTRFVTTEISSEAVLDVFIRRPFFMLVSVDAPLTVRWHRSQRQQAPGSGEQLLSLEDFVTRNDTHLYDHRTSVQHLISRATIRLLNTSSSLADLYAHLGKLDFPNPDRLRPGWDSYFMALASLAAQRSNCMKRRVGCVLVGRERRVISTGYNGTPRGLRNCAEGGCPRCNDGSGSGVGLATCLCIHAEENALLEAGRERIRDGAVLYCDTCPCLTCSIKICQVGISEVVYAHGYSMDNDTAAVFSQAGVKLRQFISVSIRTPFHCCYSLLSRRHTLTLNSCQY